MKKTVKRIPYVSAPINTIGVLFGSFDPPHQGHIDICLRAKKFLKLQDIFWIVTPQNPFKVEKTTMSTQERLVMASDLVVKHNFRVGVLEEKFHTVYTHDSLYRLIRLYPQSRFVFIVGSDILPRFLRWRFIHRMVRYVAIYVSYRPGYFATMNASAFSSYYLQARKKRENVHFSHPKKYPLWLGDRHVRNSLSSSVLRQKEK